MKRFFYADDDMDNRELFVSAIQEISQDSEVILAKDGAELCKQLKEKIPPFPNFVFLDLNMPIKSGFDCLKEIKANPFYNSMRVVILSTSSNPHDIEFTYSNGADYFICKPNSYNKYKALINKVLHFSNTSKRNREDFIIN